MNKIIVLTSLMLCMVLPVSQLSAKGQVKGNKGDAPVTAKKAVINLEARAIKGIVLDDVTHDKKTFKLARPVIDKKYRMFREAPFDQLRDLYKKTGYVNLTHLYWKAGALDLKDDIAIDAFLLLTQCKRVGASYGDDFEWNAFRLKARGYLKKNRSNFSKKFKFTQPMELGAYDFKNKNFEIKPKYSYDRSKRFLISNNLFNRTDFCVNNNFSYRYKKYAPYNVVMHTNNPFTMLNLPMSAELSRIYLRYLDENGLSKIPVITFYVNLELFQEAKFESKSKDGYVAEFSGSVDYVEVHADKKKTRLLYKRDLR